MFSLPNKLFQFDDLITVHDPTVNDLTLKFLPKNDFSIDVNILLFIILSCYSGRTHNY